MPQARKITLISALTVKIIIERIDFGEGHNLVWRRAQFGGACPGSPPPTRPCFDFAINESFGQYVIKVPKATHRTRMQTQWNMTSRATSY